MSGSNIKIILVLCAMVMGLAGSAQTKRELQTKKKKLKDEIAYTNKLLKKTSESKTNSMDHLVKLNKKIKARAEIISTIAQEIKLLDLQIEKNKVTLVSLESDLQELREEYSEMIYYTYKNRSSYNRLMYLFSSKNFNQAYKRLRYMQQYTSYRKRQAELIIKTQASIDQTLADLEQTRQQKASLLSSKEYEKGKFTSEKIQQENIVSTLKQKEKDLTKELKRKERTALKVQKAIEEIIKEEIRLAREAAKGGSSKGFPMTPEARQLSMNFASNKGKLPWPVVQGVVTGSYGEHPHPVLKNIKIQNNGVDISTTKGAIARSIFDGVVSRILIIPGEGKSILIRHGEYLSVYSYMTEVFVKAGDKVKTKQDIGVLVTDKANSKTDIHFELWKNVSTLNPEYWLYFE